MTNAEKAKLRESWRVRVADFRASGQTGAAWCVANQIKEHQLWYWVHRLSDNKSTKKSAPTWIPIEIDETNNLPSQTGHPMLIRVGQATVEVKPGFDATLFRNVVQTLMTLC